MNAITYPDSVQLIKFDLLVRPKKQSRTKFRRIEELANSIEAKGLNTPLTVVPREDGRFDIQAGSRRHMAITLIRERHPLSAEPHMFEQVPCLIREQTRGEEAVSGLIDNVVREDLEYHEAALEIGRLQEKHKMKGADIARAIGKTEAYVSYALGVAKEIHPDTVALLNELPDTVPYKVIGKIVRDNPKNGAAQVQAIKDYMGKKTPHANKGRKRGEKKVKEREFTATELGERLTTAKQWLAAHKSIRSPGARKAAMVALKFCAGQSETLPGIRKEARA